MKTVLEDFWAPRHWHCHFLLCAMSWCLWWSPIGEHYYRILLYLHSLLNDIIPYIAEWQCSLFVSTTQPRLTLSYHCIYCKIPVMDNLTSRVYMHFLLWNNYLGLLNEWPWIRCLILKYYQTASFHVWLNILNSCLSLHFLYLWSSCTRSLTHSSLTPQLAHVTLGIIIWILL